jgi:hypothetical protein
MKPADFLAVDFDKEEWKENSRAYLETCETFNVSAAEYVNENETLTSIN